MAKEKKTKELSSSTLVAHLKSKFLEDTGSIKKKLEAMKDDLQEDIMIVTGMPKELLALDFKYVLRSHGPFIIFEAPTFLYATDVLLKTDLLPISKIRDGCVSFKPSCNVPPNVTENIQLTTPFVLRFESSTKYRQSSVMEAWIRIGDMIVQIWVELEEHPIELRAEAHRTKQGFDSPYSSVEIRWIAHYANPRAYELIPNHMNYASCSEGSSGTYMAYGNK